jgi:hypothetical protein
MVTRLRLGASMTILVEPKGPAPLRQGTGSSNPACRSVSTPRGRSPPLTGLSRHQGPQLIATRFLLPVLRPSDRGAVEMAIELPSAVRKPDPPKVKDNVMSDEEPIDSILAEDAMEKNRDYVFRGRRFRVVDTDILRQRWTETFKIWAADLANQDRARRSAALDRRGAILSASAAADGEGHDRSAEPRRARSPSVG